MLILLVPLVLALLAWIYWRNRNDTLTRNCRWRADRTAGPGHFTCASCGGRIKTENGEWPRVCVAREPRATG